MRASRFTVLPAMVVALLGAAAAAAERFDFEGYKARMAWIWRAPQRPAVPEVNDAGWPEDAVDRFVLARLEAAGMRPAGDAGDAEWLRRIHFATTGLPPTPAQAARFEGDLSPDRRRRALRRLLDSPHFGERWARHWMDLVRYAESRGHESDFIIANAWRYRDYLVRAFNADVPYDQLLLEHVAGDLLPQPRLDPESGANESVLATGWPFFGEEVHSPVEIRQDECDRTDNKIDVFGKTFLGLTISCARCHDHKFDAIRQDDYYALSGFIAGSGYRQVRYESLEHNRAVAAELGLLRDRFRPVALRELAERAAGVVAAIGEDRELAGPSRVTGFALPGDDSVRVIADYSRRASTAWKPDGPTFGAGPVERGDVLLGTDAGGPALDFAGYSAARRDPYWNGLRNVDSENDSGSLDAMPRAGKTLRTPTFELKSGRLHYLIRGKAKVYAAVSQHIMVTGPLHKQLVRGFAVGGDRLGWVTHDLGRYAGLRAYVDFGAIGDQPFEILAVVEAERTPALSVEEPVFGRAELRVALNAMAAGKPPPADAADAAAWIARQVDFKAGEIGGGEYLAQLEELRARTRWESRTAVAWMDGTGVDDYLLDRGSPQTPLATVPRGLPQAMGFPRIRAADVSGRLELAGQMTDPRNPLVARVMVNRVWHHLFGRGIVGTVDNFGWLGERPTHPGLLDYLAVEFVETHQWSVKALIERLLLTRSFAMSSRAAEEGYAERDPDNLLLHRMPVRRLEAEAIRDSALAISGGLDRTIGGKPVPVHLDEFVIGRGRPGNSGPLDGAGRRSIYTALRRNFLPTLMLAFDFPSPFSTVGRRDVTNVPAQSLALMNDPFLYQQAGLWADRLLRDMPDAPPQDRIDRMFREAFARSASDAEIVRCLESLREFGALYGGNPDARDAWRDLCHAMFSLHEFIYVK